MPVTRDQPRWWLRTPKVFGRSRNVGWRYEEARSASKVLELMQVHRHHLFVVRLRDVAAQYGSATVDQIHDGLVQSRSTLSKVLRGEATLRLDLVIDLEKKLQVSLIPTFDEVRSYFVDRRKHFEAQVAARELEASGADEKRDEEPCGSVDA